MLHGSLSNLHGLFHDFVSHYLKAIFKFAEVLSLLEGLSLPRPNGQTGPSCRPRLR